MIVVSNASPIIALEHLGHLELLRALFTTVIVPPAVAGEVIGIPLPNWFEIRALRQPIGARILHQSLGSGESESLSLAIEIQADLVLLDEKPARRLATVLQIPMLGTLGVLLKAKQRGLIPAVQARLDALRALPFHIAPRLYDAILKDAQE